MSLKLDLKNLVFTVFGGVVVAAASYLFFSPTSEYQNKLTAEYRRVQISNAGQIIGDKALDSLIAAKDIICKELEKKDCTEKLFNLAKRIRNFDYFQNRRYTMIHELTIRNETEFAVSDLEIEHGFAYPGYIIYQENDKSFHTLSRSSVFSVEELKPGKKVEAIFFSEAGYPSDANNINVTESGRVLGFRPMLESPDEKFLFSEELSSLFGLAFRYPSAAYIIAVVSILSCVGFVFALMLLLLSQVFPEWFMRYTAKNITEKEYLWHKSVLDIYEESQKK